VRRRLLPICLAISAAGCAPVINIAGADFPAWMLCAVAGAVLTALLRPLFVALRIEAHLGPLPLIYFSLALLLACGTWLLFFNRV
jgi:hypothetical protein